MKLQTKVFISGSGTNLQALIDNSKNGLLPIEITQVISNNQSAQGLTRAENAQIPTLVMTKKVHQSREHYDTSLVEAINKTPYQLIVLAGWMHVLTPNFLNNLLPNTTIINLHPALPGQFPGKQAIEDAWNAYQNGMIKETGVMVHEVVSEVDAGRVLAQQRIPINNEDTFQTLSERIRYYEKPLLLQAIQMVYDEKRKSSPILFNLSTSWKQGKVRDIYDLGYNLLMMVQTDRQSAFDRQICTVPGKGRILTQTSRWWFQQTQHIIPNHYLYSEGNMMIVKKATPIPLEFVVRGFMTGNTKTSLWTHYEQNPTKPYCGITFPEGMRKNQQLSNPVVTPTTKGNNGDELISGEEIVERKIMPQELWEQLSQKSLQLFRYGQAVAQSRGLILVDTKYEFGTLPNGEVVLIDEIHTCDSSRYWKLNSYVERFKNEEEPERLDKDLIREYIKEKTVDPYAPDPLPKIPDELLETVEESYNKFYAQLTGEELQNDYPQATVQNRVQLALGYFNRYHSEMVVILTGNTTEQTKVKEFHEMLNERNIYSVTQNFGLWFEAPKLVEMVRQYSVQKRMNRRKIVFVTVGDELNDKMISGLVADNTGLPVLHISNKNTELLGNSKAMVVSGANNGANVVQRIFNL